jgi:ATP synthase subunit 6
MPSGAPLFLAPFLMVIEIISNFSRPIALGMRLAANITAGHIILSILANFSIKFLLITASYAIMPIFIITFMTLLELGVLIIQAYVFVLLITIYLRDSVELH